MTSRGGVACQTYWINGCLLSSVVLRLGISYGSRLTFVDMDAGATPSGGCTEEGDAMVELGRIEVDET